MTTIKRSSIPELKSRLDIAVEKHDGIPGVQYFAVNKNGEYIFEHTAGKIGVGKKEPMTDRNVCWIASCTKMITGIAAMQLVERGELELDDVEMVERIAPELKDVKVLGKDGKLVEKKKGITLRMLLTHTAGFSYSFYSHELADAFGPTGVQELSGHPDDYMKQPLINQPGEAFQYGINIDWVGIIVMRVSGLSLEQYFKKNITGPLGIDKDISFLPDEEMRKDLAYCHFRDPAGKIRIRDDGHLFHHPLRFTTEDEAARIFQSGGAGMFARPKAYCQIIAMLLNNGVHAPSGKKILKKETVDMMFTNQLPDMPDFARQGVVVSKPEYSNALPEFYPEPNNPPQGWGLTFFLHVEDSVVHSKGTAWWAGLPNLFWWCDRTKGIGGMIATQIIPFGDLKVVNLWGSVEGVLYASLEQQTELVDRSGQKPDS